MTRIRRDADRSGTFAALDRLFDHEFASMSLLR